MENIGEKIRYHRTKANYSQEDIAQLLGMSLKAYTNIERNATKNLTLARLEQIAQTLKISIADFFEEKAKMIVQNLNNHHQSGGNIYNEVSEKTLLHTIEKLSMENTHLQEKNTLLATEIGNLKEIIALMKEKK
jgi:transcriptional regulator with XRE-family HTH domain